MHELSGRMREDDYGCYTVGSLYFDTEDYRLIRDSLEKPVYKEKLRLRGYGVPQGTASVFWELKKKYDGVTYKRRAVLPLHRAEQYFRLGIPAGKARCCRKSIGFSSSTGLRRGCISLMTGPPCPVRK